MNKWNILKSRLRGKADAAKAAYDDAPNYSDSRSMFLQEFTDCLNTMNTMHKLEVQEAKQDSLSKSFMKFLDRGIGAKDWETTLKKTIRKCPDEANFWDGYTAALIEMKAFYGKIQKKFDEN